jgi:hypothetical protein
VALRVAAAFVTLGAFACLAAATMSCGTDAIGIESCRDIETARCSAAALCGLNTQEVADCKNFYHDQCLHGIENTVVNDGGDPPQSETNGCVNEIVALQRCIQAGAKTMADCSKTVTLTVGIDPSVSKKAPCDVLMHEVEDLAACDFVVLPADAGLPDAADAGGDAFIL